MGARVSESLFQAGSTVELVEHTGSDEGVVRAARVSVHGAQAPAVEPGTVYGLIGHMMRNRHGSVFEHNVFTFRIHAPIFVHREFMTHRTISKNTESARYSEIDPVFWVPSPTRKLRQEGKPSAYKLVEGSHADYLSTCADIMEGSEDAYARYRRMLDRGIAREVARAVLPVNTFTSFYATCNARALMSFLSLRVDSPLNAVPTHPQAEIQEVAEKMEAEFSRVMPATHRAFVNNGRVAP
jgi:thymidylate synthase (FAD)